MMSSELLNQIQIIHSATDNKLFIYMCERFSSIINVTQLLIYFANNLRLCLNDIIV